MSASRDDLYAAMGKVERALELRDPNHEEGHVAGQSCMGTDMVPGCPACLREFLAECREGSVEMAAVQYVLSLGMKDLSGLTMP